MKIVEIGATGNLTQFSWRSMFFIVGMITVIVSVLGGYAAMGGHLGVLWQPFEAVIIVGSAVGAFIISNTKTVLIESAKSVGILLKGRKYDKDAYLELLCLLYAIFKVAKSKGMLALETDIENPEESKLFQQFPKF